MLLPSYLDSLQIILLLVTVQDYVIGHAETFSHSQVIEKGRLAEGVAHLHHSYICRGEKSKECDTTLIINDKSILKGYYVLVSIQRMYHDVYREMQLM